MYSPLTAMVAMCGNRSRTTARNSNPDIRGIFKSEMIKSGSDLLSACKPSSPSAAVRTSLGDPEAVEYGDFENVHHECKDNCTHKRSSHNE